MGRKAAHQDGVWLGPLGIHSDVPSDAALAGFRAKASLEICAPGHLLARQRLIAPHVPLFEQTGRDCCVFVLGLGDDEDRMASRVGGRPYWPTSLSWPKQLDGRPMQFIAQFDFRLVQWPEPLPGDILTIHGIDPNYDDLLGWDGSGVRFHWHKADNGALIAENPPDEDQTCGPFYTRPVRVRDYKLTEPSDGLAFEHVSIEGMKIGGHSPLRGDNPAEILREFREPVFLCSVVAVPAGGAIAGEPEVWLPAKPGIEPDSIHELHFPASSFFAVFYERGSPQRLFWVCYLP